MLGADVGSMERRQISVEDIWQMSSMGTIVAFSGTVHLLAEKLHYTSLGKGHTLAEFDTTNAVAKLTCRGQFLHLFLTSAAGSQSRQLVANFTWVVVRSVYKCLR